MQLHDELVYPRGLGDAEANSDLVFAYEFADPNDFGACDELPEESVGSSARNRGHSKEEIDDGKTKLVDIDERYFTYEPLLDELPERISNNVILKACLSPEFSDRNVGLELGSGQYQLCVTRDLQGFAAHGVIPKGYARFSCAVR
jgi:hypothetical protein